MKKQIRKVMALPGCLLAVFLMGTGAAATVERWKTQGEAVNSDQVNLQGQEEREETLERFYGGQIERNEEDTRINFALGQDPEQGLLYAGQSLGSTLFSEDWGLGFGDPGTKPKGNASVEELAGYHSWFLDPTEEKVIYLTFDCGFDNGYTESMMETLEKHQVPATFFVVGNFLETRPDLVKKMVEKGFTVGNHTYHHPDMGSVMDPAAFEKELKSLEEKYQEITGKEMPKFYRPPQGKYSLDNLEMAKELGYETFFWSLAYVDWYVDKQPAKDKAIELLTRRIHPGAIVLLHNTSSTNKEILDELLTKWEEMGYTFKALEDIGCQEKENQGESGKETEGVTRPQSS